MKFSMRPQICLVEDLVFEAGAVANQNRCVCAYLFLCSLDVCQNPHEHQICAHLSLCVVFILCGTVWWAVCVVKYAWRFVCIQGCKWIAFHRKLNSRQLSASRPAVFKSYGSNLHELNTLDSAVTNCKLCLIHLFTCCGFAEHTGSVCLHCSTHSLVEASTKCTVHTLLRMKYLVNGHIGGGSSHFQGIEAKTT